MLPFPMRFPFPFLFVSVLHKRGFKCLNAGRVVVHSSVAGVCLSYFTILARQVIQLRSPKYQSGVVFHSRNTPIPQMTLISDEISVFPSIRNTLYLEYSFFFLHT